MVELSSILLHDDHQPDAILLLEKCFKVSYISQSIRSLLSHFHLRSFCDNRELFGGKHSPLEMDKKVDTAGIF